MDIRLPAVSTAAMQCFNAHKFDILDEDTSSLPSIHQRHASFQSVHRPSYILTPVNFDALSLNTSYSFGTPPEGNEMESQPKATKSKKLKKEAAVDEDTPLVEK